MPVLSRPRPPDDCGYQKHAKRIVDYQIVHAPEAVVPFSREDFPDGCSYCGPSIWEYRKLSDGRLQHRCTGCGSVITWD